MNQFGEQPNKVNSVINILQSYGENIKDIRLRTQPFCDDSSRCPARARIEYTLIVECGVLPKCATLNPIQRVPFTRMNLCIRETVIIARSKYPLSSPSAAENTTVLPWAIIEINFMRNGYITVEYKRGTRDIWVRAAVNIHRHLPHELVWFSRASYLSFVEGCPEAYGHMARYLMNEVAQQNICEYMIPDKFAGEMSDPSDMKTVMIF